MEDELIQRHAYNSNSNTSQLKTTLDKRRQNEIHIDSLHIMTMTGTITMILSSCHDYSLNNACH